jgi:radical SAM superfamily enzyme YgiQ (UPF0313 family)
MLDIVIVNVPGTLVRLPFAAPALLKSSIESAEMTCKTVDFNIRFYHSVDEDKIQDLENFFSTGVNVECTTQAEQLVENWADELVKLNPRYVGISVFTYQNRTATEILCRYLKQKSSIKIILGGQGLTDGGILGPQGFAKKLIEQGLAEYYIKSEGEHSLVELLKGNLQYPGINNDNFEQIRELDTLPVPDYSDYELDLYSRSILPITSSRGCVRACSFCDIHDHWKYEYRSGELVAREMIELSKKYNIDDFFFTDSLVNGSLKEFNEFCRVMADYNRSQTQKITWGGQYIVRSENTLTEKYWDNLSQSGARRLAIGVETGSDRVRLHMNKKFTNVDLDYTMLMLDKYSITCIFLIIIGYPTETEQDFQDTLIMLGRYQHLANRIIVDVNFGSTLGILPGTPLYNKAKEYNIDIDTYENNWTAYDNPTLTINERITRLKQAKDYALDLGYAANDDSEGILNILERQIPTFEKRNKIKKMIKLKEVQ